MVTMRRADETSGSRTAKSICKSASRRHQLRKIRQGGEAGRWRSAMAVSSALDTDFGRPFDPPERLIRASLIQILFPSAPNGS